MVIAMFIGLLICWVFHQARYIWEVKIIWDTRNASSITTEIKLPRGWRSAGGHTVSQTDHHVGRNLSSWKNCNFTKQHSTTQNWLFWDYNDSKHNALEIGLQPKPLAHRAEYSTDNQETPEGRWHFLTLRHINPGEGMMPWCFSCYQTF